MIGAVSLGATLEELQRWGGSTPARIVVVAVVALVARAFAVGAIRRVVDQAVRRSTEHRSDGGGRGTLGHEVSERARQRTLTMGSLLRSIVTFVIGSIAILTILDLLGVPLRPLLASAGVAGVALGFGAQSLVKDFLAGVFMILEDQYGVGDVIDTGEAIGTVEEVSLRVTRLRDANGVIWYVRNGEIVRIANRSQGWSTALVDVPVSYQADIDEAIDVVGAVVHDLATDGTWGELLIEEPEVLGVEAVGGGTVTIRVLAKCLPDKHWGVQRAIRRRCKEALDAAGIAGPPAFAPPTTSTSTGGPA